MSELQDAIEQVRDKILRYSKASTSINEQNTKASLIQPIMRSLGWDVEDLDDVHMEYKERAADKPVDYALLLLRSPCAFIEAKSLGSPLDDRKWANQIMGYASVAGVEWVVLTNGDEYRIYNSHAAVPVEEKLFRAVKVSDAETDPEATLCLLSKDLMKERQINRLWELHFVDRQVTSALRQLFSTEGEPSASVVRLLSKNVPSLTLGEIKASLRRVEIQISCPLTIEQGKSETAKTETAKSRKKKTKRKVKAIQGGVSLIELINKKILSAPLTLFKKYKGKELLATVRVDGTVEFDGQQYESCSTAAAYARGTIVGGTPSTNGWEFWKYRDSEGKVHHLDHARCVYRQQQTPES
jgi:predicted type IV restriction endonuclease